MTRAELNAADIRRRFADEREAMSRRHVAEMRELNKRETDAIDRIASQEKGTPSNA